MCVDVFVDVITNYEFVDVIREQIAWCANNVVCICVCEQSATIRRYYLRIQSALLPANCRNTAGQIVAVCCNTQHHTNSQTIRKYDSLIHSDSQSAIPTDVKQTYSHSCSILPNGCSIRQHTALGQIVAVYCNTQHHTNSQTIRRNDSLIHSESHSVLSTDVFMNESLRILSADKTRNRTLYFQLHVVCKIISLFCRISSLL